jgi:hypothetical protein
MDSAAPEQPQPAATEPKKPRYSKKRTLQKPARLKVDARPPKIKKKSKLHWTQRPGKRGNVASRKFKDELCGQAEALAMLGLTNKEIAPILKVHEATIDQWEKRYENFRKALEKGRWGSLAEVGKSLYKRAIGYDHPDGYIVKIDPVTKERTMVPTTLTHKPGDVPAQKYIISSLLGKQWTERSETQVTGTVTGLQPLVIAITQAEMPRAKELKPATVTEVATVAEKPQLDATVLPPQPQDQPTATTVRVVESIVAVEPDELPKPAASGRFQTFQEEMP